MKIDKLINKTGLNQKDASFLKISLTGILAVISSLFFSCSNSKTEIKEPSQSTVVSTETYQVSNTTASISNLSDTPVDFNKKNCGPTPGYPCGTKYYTISYNDFVL